MEKRTDWLTEAITLSYPIFKEAAAPHPYKAEESRRLVGTWRGAGSAQIQILVEKKGLCKPGPTQMPAC
eukprot:scaffold190819_cov17-Tisochrysis_lutea.AAC.1